MEEIKIESKGVHKLQKKTWIDIKRHWDQIDSLNVVFHTKSSGKSHEIGEMWMSFH